MSFISAIRNFFGLKPVAQAVKVSAQKSFEKPTPKRFEDGPLGLAVERYLKIDGLMIEGIKEQLSMGIPEDFEQKICAYGKIDLGDSNYLHRYYLFDGDSWIQIVSNGEGAHETIENISFFSYESAPITNNPSEVERLIGRSSDIGLPEIKRHNKTFLREWGTEEGQTDLVAYSEFVVTDTGEQYTIDHKAMLYYREIEDSVRSELLIFSLEESPGEADATISTSYGVNLIQSDISVI
ncbi:DUF2491 family protein [Pseudomonas viridiflava]|uniref:DUF2491 family protein n=1 Tax=Pseudomonas viridiflava TaxID=33069 RepID=UPI0018E5E21C|nr:DUF2491 family protein [Pseudomonas viridiflava]MBI6727370.1 DUF2491 family protein [Pseudomonas viridiflava]